MTSPDPLADLPPLQSEVANRMSHGPAHGTAAPPPQAIHSEPAADADESWLDSSALADRAPAWFISMIVHTILLIILVVFKFSAGHSSQTLIVRLERSESDVNDFTPTPDTIPLELPPLTDKAVVTELSTTQVVGTPVEVTSPLRTESTSQDDAPQIMTSLEPASGQAMMAVQLPQGGLYRRDAKSRAELGAKFGATPESEEAVEAGLRWLAAHQQLDGSWSFDLHQEPCNGQCKNSQKEAESPRPATAATGLALLAFLGAGYSQHEGKYRDQIKRGLYFLREIARPASAGLDFQDGSMYGHGIALMAISEAMSMSRYHGAPDSDLIAMTQGGANFTASAQHALGGWRYVPGSPGDMTVTAWQVLSLISAQHGGIVIASNTLARAEQFIRGLSKPNAYSFGYQSVAAERSTTAVGLCTLLYLGQSPHDEAFAAALNALVERGPKFTDVYHDYYATLALHHARHAEWQAWHVPLRDRLIATQAKDGHEAGSWHFPDRNGDIGGRLYTTAMVIMTLEVYYRYLPLYQTRDDFKLD